MLSEWRFGRAIARALGRRVDRLQFGYGVRTRGVLVSDQPSRLDGTVVVRR